MRGSPAIDRLIASLKRLPGIGDKSASRLAFFLVLALGVETALRTLAGTLDLSWQDHPAADFLVLLLAEVGSTYRIGSWIVKLKLVGLTATVSPCSLSAAPAQ